MKRLSWTMTKALTPERQYSCGLRWGFHNIAGLVEPTSPAQLVGRAVESAISLKVSPPESFDEYATIDEVVADLVAEPEVVAKWGSTGELKGRLLETAEKAMRAFAGLREIEHGTQFERDIDEDASAIGYADWTAASGWLVEHKFSQRAKWNASGAWNREFVHDLYDQAAFYRWLSEDQYKRVRAVVTVWTKGTVDVRWQDHDIEKARAQRMAFEGMSAWASHLSGAYSANPGQHCGWCAFQKECRRTLRPVVLSSL